MGVMIAAIALVVLSPTLASFLRGVGIVPAPTFTMTILRVSAALGSVAIVVTRRWITFGVALAGEIALHFVCSYIKGSDWELIQLHLVWLAALVAAHARTETPSVPLEASWLKPRRWHLQDGLLFGGGLLVALVVCGLVLKRQIDSSDEWAYTFQAAVLARGRAYANSPSCS